MIDPAHILIGFLAFVAVLGLIGIILNWNVKNDD